MSRSRTIGFPLRRWCTLLVVAGAIGLAVAAHAGLVGQLLAGRSLSAPVLVLTAIAFVVKTALIMVHRKHARREEQG